MYYLPLKTARDLPFVYNLLKLHKKRLFNDLYGDVVFEGGFNCAIFTDEGDFAGAVWLYDFNSARKIASICFVLKQKFWGKTALKIARETLDLIFKALDLEKINAETFSTNPLPKHLLKALGFEIKEKLTKCCIVDGKKVDATIFSINNPRKNS